MATVFRPLTVAMIEEGGLVRELDEQFAEIQRQLANYVREHGDAGGKAKLTLQLELRCKEVGSAQTRHADALFTVSSGITASAPTRPKRVTAAIAGEDDAGELRLFSRASGTTADHPRQTKLCTDDGRGIDPSSGEVQPSTPPSRSTPRDRA